MPGNAGRQEKKVLKWCEQIDTGLMRSLRRMHHNGYTSEAITPDSSRDSKATLHTLFGSGEKFGFQLFLDAPQGDVYALVPFKTDSYFLQVIFPHRISWVARYERNRVGSIKWVVRPRNGRLQKQVNAKFPRPRSLYYSGHKQVYLNDGGTLEPADNGGTALVIQGLRQSNVGQIVKELSGIIKTIPDVDTVLRKW